MLTASSKAYFIDILCVISVLHVFFWSFLCSIRDITKEVAAAVVREALKEDLAEGYRHVDARQLQKLNHVCPLLHPCIFSNLSWYLLSTNPPLISIVCRRRLYNMWSTTCGVQSIQTWYIERFESDFLLKTVKCRGWTSKLIEVICMVFAHAKSISIWHLT